MAKLIRVAKKTIGKDLADKIIRRSNRFVRMLQDDNGDLNKEHKVRYVDSHRVIFDWKSEGVDGHRFIRYDIRSKVFHAIDTDDVHDLIKVTQKSAHMYWSKF